MPGAKDACRLYPQVIRQCTDSPTRATFNRHHTVLTRLSRSLALGILLAFSFPLQASLLDEIQVYTDDLNAPGEFGAEIHINTTPKGLTAPSYPGEAVNHRGIRVTPELSWGLTPSFEAGLYLPVTRTGDGVLYGAGLKLRAKWLPLKAGPDGGWFAGINTELGQLKQPFSESARALEVRTILGWKNNDWLLATNPIFGWDVSPGHMHRTPDFTLAVKAARRVSASSSLGLEYYSGMGRLNQRLPPGQQDNTLYIAWDYEGAPFSFNLGLGRGLTGASDAWTLKSIIEVPW